MISFPFLLQMKQLCRNVKQSLHNQKSLSLIYLSSYIYIVNALCANIEKIYQEYKYFGGKKFNSIYRFNFLLIKFHAPCMERSHAWTIT